MCSISTRRVWELLAGGSNNVIIALNYRTYQLFARGNRVQVSNLYYIQWWPDTGSVD